MNRRERGLTEGILFTDLYQLTMAQLYFRNGLHEKPAMFDHFFRACPDYGTHRAGYCVNAGLDWLLDWMRRTRFTRADSDCLRTLRGKTGKPLFGEEFVHWLARNGNFGAISLRAVPEGRVIHPLVPIMTVSGPLAMAQILETALLNTVNFQVLIATKSARIRQVVGESAVIDFGMRRAHDRAANAATRAALIGGIDFSSNVGISRVLGYAPKGTHAHSMVQAFLAIGKSELDAFRAYADCYPDECLLLVDTIDTLGSGVPNAIRVFEELRRNGHRPSGIRLDSGDLAFLSMRSAQMLDRAGLEDVSIVLSGDLDELAIAQIHERIREEGPKEGLDAHRLIRRLVYGVGTRMATSHGCSALGGVYKLAAVRDEGEWKPAGKISDAPEKTVVPACKQAWRVYDRNGMAAADVLSSEPEEISSINSIPLRHPLTGREQPAFPDGTPSSVEPLLEEVLREGKRLQKDPGVEAARNRRIQDLSRLDDGFKRLVAPDSYPVFLTAGLWNKKERLLKRFLPPNESADQRGVPATFASGNANSGIAPGQRVARCSQD